MFRPRVLQRLVARLVIPVVVVSIACTDKTVTFVNRPFNPPVDAVNGFLGYFDTTGKQTTCGNCHSGHQADWVNTKHANAYGDLVASGHAASYCYTCHDVSQQGNKTTGLVAYDKSPDVSYRDVQCENCHGPGFQHVQKPDIKANWPLPRLLPATVNDSSCAACHTGTHDPFFDEWSQSGHAQLVTEVVSGVTVPVAGVSPSCATCHDGKTTLRVLYGVNTNYVERDSAGYFPVVCAVCHDPHGTAKDPATGLPWPGQLRFSINTTNPDENLCMKCHSRRADPVVASSHGLSPHAPQGQDLLGTAGWWPPGFDTSAIVPTHGNPLVNTRLCAGCHVNGFTVTDSTGSFTFQSTGHLFRPLPCLDQVTGIPTVDTTCAYTTTARYFGGCVKSGCHADVANALLDFTTNRNTITLLADQIWVDVDGDGNVTPGVDTGLLPDGINSGKIPATEIDPLDTKLTVAEGVLFNMRLVAEGRDPNGDRSKGVHNWALFQALLSASIQGLQTAYGPLPVSPQVKALMADINRRIPRKVTTTQISQR